MQAPLRDWFASCLLGYTQDQVVALCSGLYGIWKAWNDACFNGKLGDPAAVMVVAFAKLDEWKQAHERGEPGTSSTEDIRDRWQVPPVGVWKVNIDAGWSSSGTGFGLVVRGHAGEFIYAATHLEELR